ncbi:hypothetical protein H5410_005563 [Solanum commersonii]|uniref:Uncharacterized protein n=1 Tax=Solanum commersonii TaxID=4109 RepID=A0A9J6A739_SOLCO|nr:hypothetical protein H5410_005563 [Solanum commersonii]
MIRNASVRHLSYAGKLHVIVSILFAEHNYWALVFIHSQSLVKEVDRKSRDFLWDSTKEKRKVALVASNRVCQTKKMGGGGGSLNKLKLGTKNWYQQDRYILTFDGGY